MIEHVEYLHFHGFCGSGGGAKGFNQGAARLGNRTARLRCIGGFDVDPAAVRDFGKIAGVPGTVLDLFSREQYMAFHGHEPPPEWREATPEDIRKAAGGERPHIFFCSAPCKGFSGLLSETRSKTVKYQALNGLALRGLWLVLEAWPDDPPELVLFENVPRIASRGRVLLDQITELLHGYGYATAETFHDCGELGGLAQSRKRFLMVARHVAKVPPFLYEPPKLPLRAVGEILGRMPLPGDPRGGPMHSIPRLQWKTWVRLAFVEAGSDWRSLNNLRVVDGQLADYLIVPEYRADCYGVTGWEETAATISGRGGPTNGKYSVADPRYEGHGYSELGVQGWQEPASTLTAQRSPIQGKFSVADPRIEGVRHNNVFRIIPWAEHAQSVTAGGHPTSGGQAVADPRRQNAHTYGKYAVTHWNDASGTVIGGDDSGAYAVADPRSGSGFHGKGKYIVTPYDAPANTVISGSTTGNGAFAVADPRITRERDTYRTAGEYGVVPWCEPSGAIQAQGQYDNGRWSVADPRFPGAADKLVCVIRALDNTWHRPFTTLELAALQSLVDPEEEFDLDGNSDSSKRERIGNAVPPAAAEAIAGVMAETLLLAASGETFKLSATPVWVRPVAIALSVKTER